MGGRLTVVDCEAVGSGLLQQPTNAWTSLAFLVAGAWILWRAFRFPDRSAHPELFAFGVIVAANAPGSFLYHGVGGGWAHWLHDLAAFAIPAFVGVHDLGLLRGWRVASRLRATALILAVGGVVLGLLPGAAVDLALAATVGAVGGEFAAMRAGYRPRLGPPWTAWEITWLSVAVMLVLSGLSFALGRSGSPLCNPDGWFQLHAAWHVLGAAAAAAFAYAGLEHGLVREARS